MTINLHTLAEEAAREIQAPTETDISYVEIIERALAKLRRQMRPYNGQIMTVQEHDEIIEKLQQQHEAELAQLAKVTP